MTFYKFSRFCIQDQQGYDPEKAACMTQSQCAMVSPRTIFSSSSSSSSALSCELISIVRSIIIVLPLSIISLVLLVIILA